MPVHVIHFVQQDHSAQVVLKVRAVPVNLAVTNLFSQ